MEMMLRAECEHIEKNRRVKDHLHNMREKNIGELGLFIMSWVIYPFVTDSCIP